MRPFATGPNAVYLLTFATDEYTLQNSCMSLRTTTVSHLPMHLTSLFMCLRKHMLICYYTFKLCIFNNTLSGASLFTASLQEVLGMKNPPDDRCSGV